MTPCYHANCHLDGEREFVIPIICFYEVDINLSEPKPATKPNQTVSAEQSDECAAASMV